MVDPITPEPTEPIEHPVLTQAWTRVTYLHWPYDPADVAPLLPAGVEPDVVDGVTWVGLIAFAMRRVGVLGLPPIPYLSAFLETNVRVYAVDGNGLRSVVFLSLDADRLLPVLAARAGYRLPYIWSAMDLDHDGDVLTYTTRRRRGSAASRLTVRVGPPVEATPLDHFLTARWFLHNRFHGGMTVIAPVAHERWPLRSAELLELDDTLVQAAGLPAPVGPPRVLFSPGVDVRIARPARLRA